MKKKNFLFKLRKKIQIFFYSYHKQRQNTLNWKIFNTNVFSASTFISASRKLFSKKKIFSFRMSKEQQQLKKMRKRKFAVDKNRKKLPKNFSLRMKLWIHIKLHIVVTMWTLKNFFFKKNYVTFGILNCHIFFPKCN